MDYSYLTTFCIYTIVFSLSVFFAYLNSITGKKFFLGGAILLPSILAGARGTQIGEDFEEYLSIAELLSSAEFQWPWESGVWPPVEYGFDFLLWGLTHLFDNKAIVFGCVYGILLSLVYVGCMKLDAIYARSSFSTVPTVKRAWIGYFVFVFACLIPTFNLLRQGLSIACLTCAIPFFMDRKYLKASLLFLLALSFHKTAVFALPWILFIGDKKTEFTRSTIVLLFFGFFCLLFPFFANLFGYANYAGNDADVGGVNGSILMLPLLVLSRWLRPASLSIFILKGSILALYIWGISAILPYGYISRLYYFMEIFVVMFAIGALYIKDPSRRFVATLWVLLFVLGYRFTYIYVHSGQQLYFEWIK